MCVFNKISEYYCCMVFDRMISTGQINRLMEVSTLISNIYVYICYVIKCSRQYAITCSIYVLMYNVMCRMASFATVTGFVGSLVRSLVRW